MNQSGHENMGKHGNTEIQSCKAPLDPSCIRRTGNLRDTVDLGDYPLTHWPEGICIQAVGWYRVTNQNGSPNILVIYFFCTFMRTS